MNVLVDAHMIGLHETGNETYLVNLLQQMSVFSAHDIRLFALLRSNLELSRWPNQEGFLIDVRAGNDVSRFLVSIPHAIRNSCAQLLHVTYHAPFWIQTPYVVTIHDISYRSHRAYQSPRNFIVQNVLGYLTLLRAQLVITESLFSKAEIQRFYPKMQDRICVTPYASGSSWQPQSLSKVQSVEARFGLRKPYLLCVCKFQPRKNLERLVEAFSLAYARKGPIQLVLAGENQTDTGAKLKRQYQSMIEQQVLFLPGYLSEQDLACLYTGCHAFVFPSLYEGFGLPVLEAMQCGAPVITSNTTALPETAGSAALYVDPTDAGAIADALYSLVDNPNLVQAMRQKSLLRAQQFSWQETAIETAKIYHEAIQM